VRYRGWWPNEFICTGEALGYCEFFKLLLPPRVIGAFGEFQSAAISKKLLELGWYAFTQIFRSGIALLTYNTVVLGVILWYSIASPGKSARREEVDEHQGCSFEVISS